MKNILLSLVLFLLIIGCARTNFENEKPSDLYSCQTPDDCITTFRNIETDTCCASEIINKKYREWYDDYAMRLVDCPHTCPLSPTPVYTCEDQICGLEPQSRPKGDPLRENTPGEDPESMEKPIDIPEDDEPASGNVDTMQAYCYDDEQVIDCPSSGKYFGQDAQYASTQARYKDNGDGTITDLNTGLMWQQDPGEKIEYPDAISGVDSFDLANYDDWRVPTIKELYSLMDFRGIDPVSMESTGGARPFIDGSTFTFSYGDTADGNRIIDSQWVTNSIYESKVMGGEECFFGVNFADGRIKCYPTRKGKGYFAIYVRGSDYGENDFVDNGETILDRSTGLEWTTKDSGEGMLWSDALAYCENLELAGKSDWRLPNAKELEYIVEYSRSPDTTNSPAINPIFSTSSITNEAGQNDYPYFWTSTTHVNELGGSMAAYISFGRGMGKMNDRWMDVHGAGCQRSDPKDGVEPGQESFGPQGDARRAYNYVRCVRNGAEFMTETKPASSAPVPITAPSQPPNDGSSDGPPSGSPPPEAISACNGKSDGSSCSFTSPHGTISGDCRSVDGDLACVPDSPPR